MVTFARMEPRFRYFLNHITASTGFTLEIILIMLIVILTMLINILTIATNAMITSLMSFEMEGEVI